MQIFGRKKPISGQFVVYGPKIQIFMGVSKSFGNHIMEKPPRQLVLIVFWLGIRSNRPKLAVFGPKIQYFGGRE